MKSTLTVYTEGTLYVVIAAGSPMAEFLISDRVITNRSIIAVVTVALVAGANALKAFLSQSIANAVEAPLKAVIVNKATNPIPIAEKKTKK